MTIKIRAAAIIVHDNKILLIQRQKGPYHFYAIPGGTVEAGETPEIAVMREVAEETSLQISLIRPIYFGWIAGKLEEHFYLCQYISGTPRLADDAIEHSRMSLTSTYKPIWVPLDQLSTLEIHPSEIIEQLLQDITTGFSNNVKKIELTRTEKVSFLASPSHDRNF